MYKIEEFLTKHKLKKVREYESGVIVYSDAEQEWEYTTEVVLFTKKQIWEVEVYNPYAITLQGYKSYDKASFIDTQKVLADDIVDYAFSYKEWLEAVEKPWEVAE